MTNPNNSKVKEENLLFHLYGDKPKTRDQR